MENLLVIHFLQIDQISRNSGKFQNEPKPTYFYKIGRLKQVIINPGRMFHEI